MKMHAEYKLVLLSVGFFLVFINACNKTGSESNIAETTTGAPRSIFGLSSSTNNSAPTPSSTPVQQAGENSPTRAPGSIFGFSSSSGTPQPVVAATSVPTNYPPTIQPTNVSIVTEVHESVGITFSSKGTGYYPDSSRMEGGYVDRKGEKLRTLQQFLNGASAFVSVAMDTTAISYGTILHIKEFDAKYALQLKKLGKNNVVFCVVDTGDAFKGKGRSRIDICTANAAASVDSTVNGQLTINTVLDANEKTMMCNP